MQTRCYAILRIAGNVGACNHYALAIAGGARCVVENHHAIVIHGLIFYIIESESIGIGCLKELVGISHHFAHLFTFLLGKHFVGISRNHSSDIEQRLKFYSVPNGFGGEQYLCFGVVDDVLHIEWVKLLKNRHNGCTIGNSRNKYGNPVAGILAYKRYFVAFFDSKLAKHFVHFGYALGKLKVGNRVILAVVGQCWQFGILSKRPLIDVNNIFLHSV